MKKISTTSAPTEKKARNFLSRLIDFPVLSQFYEFPDVPPIIESKKKLKYISAGVCLLTAVAFVLLVYQGLTTLQEVSVTVIVPVTNGLDSGFVCKSLGKHSGLPYSCNFWDTNPIVDVLCNPPKPAVNCPNGCTSTGLNLAVGMGFAWYLQMKNVYFESYADCVSKMQTIVEATIAPATTATYDSQTNQKTFSYNGPISIGDNSAVLEVTVGFPGCHDGHCFIYSETGSAFCGGDGTNFNTDGTLIPDSAMDQFAKGLPSFLLGGKLKGQSNCPAPTPEYICEPFRNLGPYSCTKTTQITEPLLQVLGSSVSNAATVMTVVSMALAWIVKKWDEKFQITADKVAPMAAATLDPSS